jgi:hypothetical protein
MYNVTHKSHRMQKHKFIVTCSGMLFMKTAPSPPEHEKYCIDVWCPGRTGMKYVTHRYHQMQKDKFNITCPSVLSMQTALGPPEDEK